MAQLILSAFADEAAPDLAGQIDALHRNGIACIEPRNIDGTCIINYSEGALRDIRAKLNAAGIFVPSVGSPIGKYPIEEDFAPHLEDFRRTLICARILGASKIRMFSFFVPKGQTAMYRTEVLRRLQMMLDMADEAGVTLCHENEAKIYGEMPEQVDDLLTSLPALRGIFDAANYRMSGADPVRGIDVTLPSIGYMHIKDAIYAEQMIVPAGEGEGRVAEAINKVNDATDGTVILTLEPHLHAFTGYGKLDDRRLKGKYFFESNRDAFDFAAGKLKALLKENGYQEGEKGIWSK